jgi:hypothetical protein
MQHNHPHLASPIEGEENLVSIFYNSPHKGEGNLENRGIIAQPKRFDNKITLHIHEWRI